jgi:hypothetical protein
MNEKVSILSSEYDDTDNLNGRQNSIGGITDCDHPIRTYRDDAHVHDRV